jgi:hypothetical protein
MSRSIVGTVISRFPITETFYYENHIICKAAGLQMNINFPRVCIGHEKRF